MAGYVDMICLHLPNMGQYNMFLLFILVKLLKKSVATLEIFSDHQTNFYIKDKQSR